MKNSLWDQRTCIGPIVLPELAGAPERLTPKTGLWETPVD